MFWHIVLGIALAIVSTGFAALAYDTISDYVRYSGDIRDVFFGSIFVAITFVGYAGSYAIIFIMPYENLGR